MASNPKQIVESYLVTCARLGDRAALDELVKRYHPRFLRHAYRLLESVDASTAAVQDGWVEILRGLPKLRDDAAFPAWSFRIITRRCAKRIAELQRSRKTFAPMSEEPPARGRADEASDERELRDALRTALSELTPEQRVTIALFYLEEMSVDEVAVALDIPPGTVKSRLAHARAKLRANLEGEDSWTASTR